MKAASGRLHPGLVRVVGATLISSEEVVSSEFIELSVKFLYQNQAHSNYKQVLYCNNCCIIAHAMFGP